MNINQKGDFDAQREAGEEEVSGSFDFGWFSSKLSPRHSMVYRIIYC